MPSRYASSGGGGVKMSTSDDDIPPSLEADFAALRKLRDDDASGALKEFLGDSDDPREWKYANYRDEREPCIAVKDGRVTKLKLHKCSSLAALPTKDAFVAKCKMDEGSRRRSGGDTREAGGGAPR